MNILYLWHPIRYLYLSFLDSRFSERGRIFSKQVVRTIQVGPDGLFFTGDGSGLLSVWKWAEHRVAS